MIRTPVRGLFSVLTVFALAASVVWASDSSASAMFSPSIATVDVNGDVFDIDSNGVSVFAAVDGAVVVIDGPSMTITRTIPVPGLTALAAVPGLGVLVAAAESALELLDPVSGAIVAGPLTLPAPASKISISVDGATAWTHGVGPTGDAFFSTISLRPLQVTDTWTSGASDVAAVVAITSTVAYAATGNVVVAVDSRQGAVSASPPLDAPIVGIAELDEYYVAATTTNGQAGSIAVLAFTDSRPTVATSFAVEGTPGPPAITLDGHHLYVATKEGSLTAFSPFTLQTTASVAIGAQPSAPLITVSGAVGDTITGYVTLPATQQIGRFTDAGGLHAPEPPATTAPPIGNPTATTTPSPNATPTPLPGADKKTLASTGVDPVPTGVVAVSLLIIGVFMIRRRPFRSQSQKK